jgi:hypothetical protein
MHLPLCESAILDVKGVGLCKTWYLDAQPMQDTPEAGYGVKRRAASVASSYEWKAHKTVDVPFILRQVNH